MFKLIVALFCFQACLVQTVFGQIGWCGDAYSVRPFEYAPAAWAGSCGEFGPYGLTGPYGYRALEFAGPLAGSLLGDFATGAIGPYGGAGVGEVAVAGELPAGGAATVAGQVPILGAVEFGGPVRAAGTITIAGTCGCGCAGPYIY